MDLRLCSYGSQSETVRMKVYRWQWIYGGEHGEFVPLYFSCGCNVEHSCVKLCMISLILRRGSSKQLMCFGVTVLTVTAEKHGGLY